MSMDIDGNDYWIWDAISVTVSKVVIIETHIEFGLNNIVVPYDKDYVYPPASHPDYHGASPIAMERALRDVRAIASWGRTGMASSRIFLSSMARVGATSTTPPGSRRSCRASQVSGGMTDCFALSAVRTRRPPT